MNIQCRIFSMWLKTLNTMPVYILKQELYYWRHTGWNCVFIYEIFMILWHKLAKSSAGGKICPHCLPQISIGRPIPVVARLKSSASKFNSHKGSSTRERAPKFLLQGVLFAELSYWNVAQPRGTALICEGRLPVGPTFLVQEWRNLRTS